MESSIEPSDRARDLEPLFSLVSGEGDGFLLGVAAGDAAGGSWELGYSAITEQVTMIAYDLIQHRTVNADSIVAGLLELDGIGDEDVVYRSETADFRQWLDSGNGGRPLVLGAPSIDGAARATALGVAFRNDPKRLIAETLDLATIFDHDASSVAVSMIAAAATAASCYGQSGRDLVAGVGEAVVPYLVALEGKFPGAHRIADIEARFADLISHVGVSDGEEALQLVGGGADPVSMVLAGLLLAAPPQERFHVAVEQSARIGGSVLGAFAGGVVGARIGIKGWPWAFANDTWFAEIGRRLVRGPDEVADLPIPYAVEHHLMYGPGSGFR